ncbi:hypothetical protein [Amycolatopsis kentuckyensis]|uniref:hypothetical protein n=1 Tax=Amycolatopsis kentuckyensis TaxID=218823 RepID=UPI000A3B3B66|nr:hypothetical protein [Amycolatopsis kentuckyensis]
MNVYLAAEWDERVFRLRLGVDPVDALGSSERSGSSDVGVLIEQVPRPYRLPAVVDDRLGLPALCRTRSGRFALCFGARAFDTPPRLAIRIVDPAQRYVPRRLSVPVPDLASVLATEDQAVKPARAHRPALFPGARRPLPSGSTVLLGRAVRGAPDGPPVPWARIEAGLAGTGSVQWRAHGDRDGEFVLVVGALPQPYASSRTGTVDLDVTVHARPDPRDGDPVDSPSGSRADPLWWLPVESVAALEAADPTEAGTRLPAGYTDHVSTTQTLPRGRPFRPAPYVFP